MREMSWKLRVESRIFNAAGDLQITAPPGGNLQIPTAADANLKIGARKGRDLKISPSKVQLLKLAEEIKPRLAID